MDTSFWTPSRQRSFWRRRLIIVGGVLWFAIVTDARLLPRAAAQAARQPSDSAALRARGDYLTHHVAMCVECHSPRDEHGDIIVSEEFTGGPVLINAPFWRPDWAMREPNIAGLRGYTDEQIVTLLMTGQPTGRDRPKRPMPPFRLTKEDAEAVVAYLRSR